MKRLFIIGLLIFLARPSFGSEVDHFSTKNLSVEDSGVAIDALFNQSFAKITHRLSLISGKTCQEIDLYDAIYEELGGLGFTGAEKLLEEATKIPSKELSIKEKDGSSRSERIKDSPYASMANVGINPTGRTCCSKIYKIYGIEVGADKFGHFFSDAYQAFYFAVLKHEGKATSLGVVNRLLEKYELKTQLKNEDAVIDISEQQEKGLWGLKGTGIYSYADMATNFDGYQFWREVYRGKTPYFTCKNGNWSQARPFTFKGIANVAWDESVNCSDYLPEYKKQILEAIKSCPVEPSLCKGIGDRYKGWAKNLIHPSCLGF